MLELCHIYMFDRSMNFNFTHQLLLGSTSLKWWFLNDLCSSNSFVITLGKFIAFCKTTFSKELTFDVLSITNFSILMLDSFLNNCGARIGTILVQIRLRATVRGVWIHWLNRSWASSCSGSLRLSSKVSTLKLIEIWHILKLIY